MDDPIPARPLRRKKRIKPIVDSRCVIRSFLVVVVLIDGGSEECGLDFKLVTHRVLEDGPERTVSLSTWREQAVEEEIGGDAMSVYYVRPEDLDWGWGDGIPMAAREEIVIVPFPLHEKDDSSPSPGSGPHTSTG